MWQAYKVCGGEVMTEFTPEWIEESRELLNRISPLPWKACDCGKCGQISNKIDCVAKATIGDWGDDYPSIRRIGGSIEGRFETYMEQITYGSVSKDEGIANAKYIADACNNYPKALDEIARLQSRVQELEAEQRWIPVSERLPVEDDYYYAGYYLRNKRFVFTKYYLKNNDLYKWYNDASCLRIAGMFDAITYWRPLSQPPKDGDA